jgi:hypothetical protein
VLQLTKGKEKKKRKGKKKTKIKEKEKMKAIAAAPVLESAIVTLAIARFPYTRYR